jgi:protein-tyrosine-phosphatase
LMKLLFICTANIDRSPTGEDIFKVQPGFEVKSAWD